MSPKLQHLLWRLLRATLLVAVPVLAYFGWRGFQPDNQMWRPFGPSPLYTLIYDPHDVSAMALRGLNAELGRKAGDPKMPTLTPSREFSKIIESPRPLRPRYFLEYPHAALLLFRVGYWIQPEWRRDAIPPALPDCDYHNIAWHSPENQDQIEVWRLFVHVTRFYAGVMAVALLLLIAVLEWGYGPGTGLSGGSLLLLLPGTLFFTLNRFDILPALFTALALACLGRKRVTAAAVCLGLATLVKVYPVLFAPLILRYLLPERKSAIRFAIIYAVTGMLAFTPLLFGDDWTAVWGPYHFQMTRPPEIGTTAYGCVLPDYLAHGLGGALFRVGSLAAVMGAMLATPISSLASLLRRCTLVLMVFVSLAVFYSPQWLLWFAPLLLPLVRFHRRAGISIVALDAVTYLYFPFWFFLLPIMAENYFNGDVRISGEFYLSDAVSTFGNMLRLARFICCGFLTWYIICGEYPIKAWFDRLRQRFSQHASTLEHSSLPGE